MWLKVDDKFPTHPKCRKLEGVHFGVWLLACCWSAQHEQDGKVPQEIAYQIATRCDPRARSSLLSEEPQVVRELVAARLWHRRKNLYIIHDFLDYNPSHDLLEKRRALERRRLRKARQDRVSARKGVARKLHATPQHVAQSAPKVLQSPDPFRSVTQRGTSTNAFIQPVNDKDTDKLKAALAILAAQKTMPVY